MVKQTKGGRFWDAHTKANWRSWGIQVSLKQYEIGNFYPEFKHWAFDWQIGPVWGHFSLYGKGFPGFKSEDWLQKGQCSEYHK